MQLPRYQTTDNSLQLMQSTWSGILNPVIAAPMSGVSIISNVNLINGVNVINHLLGQMQQGWFITDINGAATIYRSQPFNNLTLTLTSNAAVTISLGVF